MQVRNGKLVPSKQVAHKATAWFPRGDRIYTKTASENSDLRTYTADSAMQLGPIQGAVGLISRTAGSSDLVIQERVGGKWREYVGDLPLWADPSKRPNTVQSTFELIQCLSQNLLVSGNGFLLVSTKTFDGYPDSIISVPRILISPIDNPDLLESGRYYVNGRGAYEPYTSMTDGDLMHLKLNTRNYINWGVSPLNEGAPPLRVGLAAEAHAELFFEQGGLPPGFFVAKDGKDDSLEETFKLYYDSIRDDPTERHRPLILEGDFEWVSNFIPPSQTQLLDSRKFTYSAAAAIYGIPPPFIGDPNNPSWGTGARELLRFAFVSSIAPFLKHVSGGLTELLPSDLRVHLVPKHFLEAEPLEKARYYERAIQAGWLLRSEVRELEGLPEVDGIDDQPEPMNNGGQSDSGKDMGRNDNIEDSV